MKLSTHTAISIGESGLMNLEVMKLSTHTMIAIDEESGVNG